MPPKKLLITENIVYSWLLTTSGGCQTAYSYINHNGVFAGFQSGNIIKLGIHIGTGNFHNILLFIVSILSFLLGTAFARILHYRFYDDENHFKRHYFVMVYSMFLMALSAIANQYINDLLAVCLLTLATASQFEEFRSVKGTPYTPMMMTGNLRKLTENLFDYLFYPNDEVKQLAKSNVIYISTILVCYITGTIFVSFLQQFLGLATIIIPISLTGTALFWLMIHAHQLS